MWVHLIIFRNKQISLLSNINKSLEKIVHERTYNFLEKYSCIYKYQYGFRRSHSTNHALIEITEKVRKALDSGKFACGIFVDLQKAFDTVNHKILLKNPATSGNKLTSIRITPCYLITMLYILHFHSLDLILIGFHKSFHKTKWGERGGGQNPYLGHYTTLQKGGILCGQIRK